MHTSTTILALLGIYLTPCLAEYQVNTVFQFAENDTWLENLRPRWNGHILATEIGPPASLLSIDPRTPGQKQVIHTFDSVLGLSGITETTRDIFYITGANTTGSNIQDPPKNATHVWRVDFTSNATKPEIELICRPTAPTGFNGLTTFNDTIILASATFQESIFAIDTTTGYTWEAIKKSNMSSINGIKVDSGYVYWTSGSVFARSKLYPNVTAGPAEVISVATNNFDDFSLAPMGFVPISGNSSTNCTRRYAYMADSVANTIMQISFDGVTGGNAESVVIAGAENSTAIAQPTATIFGSGEGQYGKLYITTGGGGGVDVVGPVGAQLLEVSLA